MVSGQDGANPAESIRIYFNESMLNQLPNLFTSKVKVILPFISSGVARVINREGQIFFQGVQPQQGALKRGAMCLRMGAEKFKRGAGCLKMSIFFIFNFFFAYLSFFLDIGSQKSSKNVPPLAPTHIFKLKNHALK